MLLTKPQDDSLRDQWRNNQKMDSKSSEWGDKYGTYAVGLWIAGAQYFWDRPNGEAHLRAIAFVTLTGETLKFSFGRERPNQLDHKSFPSGHTYFAFATATSLAEAYGWPVGCVAFPIATFVGLSRMSDDYHWASDVVAGAVWGIFWGRATYYKSSNLKTSDSAWIPYIDSNQRTGVQWVSQF